MKGISDFIGFLIILLVIVVVMLPLLLYASNLSYANYVSPTPNQEEINSQFINITYEEKNDNGILYIKYPSDSPSPIVVNIYNYSNGEWITDHYTHSGNEYCLGNSPIIEVEISYINQIYYVYLEYNTSALVG